MKKSNEIIGLPIIGILDGQEIGKVRSLVINPDKQSVDFLTIEHEDWQTSVKAIPFKKVVGIGEYALTVESESVIIDLNEIPIANQLVNKKIRIINSKVMTRKGQLLGDIKEYFIDEESGNILGVYMNMNGKELTLKSENVITFGKDIVIVNEEASVSFLSNPLELVEAEETVAKTTVSPKVEEVIFPNNVLENDEIKALKDKQVELLVGKTLSKDIYTTNGQVLFPEGTVLTEEDIFRAQEIGSNLIIEISMNVEA
ncbi:MAG: hypothetical protein K0S51_211 [Bacillales bacterium]|jgi:uncharacterized protein YrrD|nr:hypothetical protein [Bacillales bacterium]